MQSSMKIKKISPSTVKIFNVVTTCSSASARHQSQDICPPISQIVLKNFITRGSLEPVIAHLALIDHVVLENSIIYQRMGG